MTNKYIDLADRIGEGAEYSNTTSFCLGIECALRWLDEHSDQAPEHATACQVEALLALAFEQRTANLIALHQFGLSLYMDGKVTDSAVDYLEDMNRLDAQIVERIGLDGDTK